MHTDLEQALNDQINAEWYSAFLYLSMAAHFERAGLPGMAGWMRSQALEEQLHATKFFDFVLARGSKVSLQAIQAPPLEFGSPLEVFQASFAHEKKVTAMIEGLFEHADRATEAFLQWFVTEQVEEEQTASGIVDALTLVGSDGAALLAMDRELGQRAASMPPTPPTSAV